MPGLLWAADFDEGGEGIGYHATSRGNAGGVYRQTDVDIYPTSDVTGQYEVRLAEDEWLGFTVTVREATAYDLSVRIREWETGQFDTQSSFQVLIDGAAVTSGTSVPVGGWGGLLWRTLPFKPVLIPPGTHTVQLRINHLRAKWKPDSGLAAEQPNREVAVSSLEFAVRPTYFPTSVTGSGVPGFADGSPDQVRFSTDLAGLDVDFEGNLYVADAGNLRIRKVSPTGETTTLAGTGVPGTVDGPGEQAQFQEIGGLAVDNAGTCYVLDWQGINRIRIVTPQGVVSTFIAPPPTDGRWLENLPRAIGIAWHSDGTLAVVTEMGYNGIAGDPSLASYLCRLEPGATTIENQLNANPRDGQRYASEFTTGHSPTYHALVVSYDPLGSTYYLERRTAESVSHLGLGFRPAGLAATPDGSVFVGRPSDGSILRIAPDRTRSLIYGGPGFAPPLAADRSGSVYGFLDRRLQRLSPEPGYALQAITGGGGQVALAPSGGIYLADRVVTVTATPSLTPSLRETFEFLGWRGDSRDTNRTIQVTMDASKRLEAVFGARLTVNVTAGGSVVKSPDLAVCPWGSKVTLTAQAHQGSVFRGWSDGETNAMRVVRMLDHLEVWASFGPPLPELACPGSSEPLPGGAVPGQKRWEFVAGARATSPAIGAEGTVYFGSEAGKFYALDGATGQKRWGFTAGGAVVSPPAIGADGTVYFQSKNDKLYALDGLTGQKRWAADGNYTAPAIGDDDLVYVGDKNWGWFVRALDGATGQERRAWETRGFLVSAPAIGADGTIYFESRSQFGVGMRAMDAATGRISWEYNIGECTLPAIGADGTVYFGSSDAKLYALDGTTGRKRWEYAAGKPVSAPAIGVDGMVYVSSYDGSDGSMAVSALDRVSGRALWRSVVNQFGYESTASTPAIGADGVVYVGAGHACYAFCGATGRTLWQFKGADPTSPAIGPDGTVYIGSIGGGLCAVWSSSVGGLARSPWPKFGHDNRNSGHGGFVPAVTAQPTRIRLAEGRVGEITVAVSGQPEPAKQWFFNGTTMRDATNATLHLPVVTRSLEGAYWLVASNALGQATSGPIAVVVSNVDPQRFVGLSWPGTGGNGLSLESKDRLGLIAAWHTVSNFPPATADQSYVDLTGGAGAFYRLAGTGPVPAIGRAGWVNGWRFTTPAGTRHRIEYTSDSGGWGNWLLLTNLAVASGDQLYLDYDSLADPGRVYRDTVVP